MVHIGTADVIDRPWAATTFANRTVPAQHSVLVVRDHDKNSEYLEAVCEFLDIVVEHATTADDLRSMLPSLRPMAVIADLDGEVQDGFNVMKSAAGYDRSLPILLLTSNDPAMLGAVDAVQEVWGLSRVTTASPAAVIGVLVDFICRAARDAGRSRLMRV
jgi:CheY-like chemotaxis protein